MYCSRRITWPGPVSSRMLHQAGRKSFRKEAQAMRNLLALIGAVVVLVAGLGWYLEWYKLGVEPGTPGHPKINVEVETDKIKDDLKKGRESVGGLLHNEKKNVEGIPTGVEKKSDGSWNVPSSLK